MRICLIVVAVSSRIDDDFTGSEIKMKKIEYFVMRLVTKK